MRTKLIDHDATDEYCDDDLAMGFGLPTEDFDSPKFEKFHPKPKREKEKRKKSLRDHRHEEY